MKSPIPSLIAAVCLAAPAYAGTVSYTFKGVTSQNFVETGASTTFKVSFKPKAKGTRNAKIAIASNDSNENPFNISLTGSGRK